MSSIIKVMYLQSLKRLTICNQGVDKNGSMAHKASLLVHFNTKVQTKHMCAAQEKN